MNITFNFLTIILLSIFISIYSIIPTGELKIRRTDNIIYVAPGSFGTSLEKESETSYKRLLLVNGDTHDGCENPSVSIKNIQSFYLLVSRGNCSFVDKAIAAESIGAVGVIIYNSLEGIYQDRSYALDTDYDCDKGSGYVTSLQYPIYSDEMDALMPTSCTGASTCDSGKCVLTNVTDSNGYKVCCAWDLYISMGNSEYDDVVSPNIPAVFIRMTDADTLISNNDLSKGTLEVALFSRPSYALDVSSILLWLMAVLTVAVGASRAAEEDKNQQYNSKYSDHSNSYQHHNELIDDNTLHETSQSNINYEIECTRTSTNTTTTTTTTNTTITNSNPIHSQTKESKKLNNSKFDMYLDEVNDETFDISPSHAVGFIFISSSFLVLLYFIDLYSIVVIMYLFAATLACTVVYFIPLFKYIQIKCMALHNPINSSDIMSTQLHDWYNYAAVACSILVAVTWYIANYYGETWIWVVQDFMGIAVCLIFLDTIRIPNLQVATVLLGLAFLYDVFFVFISPLIFSSSIMLKVVSGNNTGSITDENFCEKYPTNKACQSTSLPMLLLMPTFSSYLSSESMLGLGDIVLPGLLLVWSARYDMRRYGTLNSDLSSKGYFPMTLFGYGVGLLLANFAVFFFESGQPALFYIVPLTLGPILFRSFKSETLRELWIKLPPMKTIALPLDHAEQVI